MDNAQSKLMTFKALLDEYRDACSKWKAGRHENNEPQTRKWRGEARSLALMIADFIIDHSATVTFTAEPTAPEFDPNANFERVPGGWRKRTHDDDSTKS